MRSRLLFGTVNYVFPSKIEEKLLKYIENIIFLYFYRLKWIRKSANLKKNSL